MTLSQFLKAYREEHHISMRRFAEMAGISHQMIGVLEAEKGGVRQKKVTPSNATLKKLALCYSLGVDERSCMRLGGWSDVGTVNKIYTHISERSLKASETKLIDFFR